MTTSHHDRELSKRYFKPCTFVIKSVQNPRFFFGVPLKIALFSLFSLVYTVSYIFSCI